MKKYKVVQLISGSDSCGGAGMQADIKTATSLGVYSMSALTALTAQNTCGVDEIYDLEPSFVRKQLETNYKDIFFDAIKIGMLHKTSLISEVASFLKDKELNNIVLDPVMVAASKAVLLEDEAISSLKKDIFPLCDIITPNLYEANLLCGFEIYTKEDAQKACIYLSEFSPKYVLIKSLEFDSKYSYDCLYDKRNNEFTYFKNLRIDTKNTHGTGCTLSSAIACFLAKGFSMKTSVEKANTYVYEAIKDGALFAIGKEKGPINHMHKL